MVYKYLQFNSRLPALTVCLLTADIQGYFMSHSLDLDNSVLCICSLHIKININMYTQYWILGLMCVITDK